MSTLPYSAYGRPTVPPPNTPRRSPGDCLEGVWVRSTHLPCEGREEHEIHFAQFGRHIIRWWGPIGATKTDPLQFLFPE